MDRYAAVSYLARGQHGLVTRRQLADRGLTTYAVQRAIVSGRLELLSPRVLRVAGSADTPEQRLMAATLDVPGSAIALHSAAAMWQIPGFDLEPAHVLTTRSPHRDRARVGKMHSSVSLAAPDIVALIGIPITTPLRTLADLAGRVHADRLSQICDRMLSTNLIRLAALHALVATLPPRGGRLGTGELRKLALARPDGYRAPESNLERRFEWIIERAGDPPFERQVDLGDGEGWIGRVDFVDRRLWVIVEVQSSLFHSGLVDRERDALRIARLRRAGWIVVEVTDEEVWHRAPLVVARVRSARAGALRRKLAHESADSARW